MGNIGPIRDRYEVLPLREPAAPQPVMRPARPRERLVRLIRRADAKD